MPIKRLKKIESYKIYDYVLCVKDRISLNGRKYHVKGKKYRIYDIFVKYDKTIFELNSDENINVQYSFCEDKDTIYCFQDHFVNQKELRKKKIEKLKKI